MPEPDPRPKKKTGHPSDWSDDLGLTHQDSPRYPLPIWALLKSKKVKALLNWMAMNEDFRTKILSLVPDGKPPAKQSDQELQALGPRKMKP
jgi:hypothetical protein